MQKILIPTDFSKYSDYAIDFAASLAVKSGGEIVLLHVIHQPIYSNDSLNALFSSVGEGAGKLNDAIESELIQELEKPKMEGLSVKTRVEVGNISEQIIRIAEEEGCDSICIGLFGQNNTRSIYGGSVTQKVIRKAKYPVFTIKTPISELKLEKIVFTSTFFLENSKLLPRVSEIARLFNSELHLLKVITPQSFERTAYSEKVIEDLAGEARVIDYVEAIVNDDTVEKGVYWYATKIGADMICIGTHERRNWEQVLSKSVAEEISHQAHVPVMTLKIEKMPEEDGILFPE